MLSVTFFKDSRERLSSVSAEGHAQWDEAGQDIVCAAVSAILQAARLGLEQHAQANPSADQTKGRFRLTVRADRRDDAAVAAILGTAHLAVTQVAQQYPDHVRCAIESLKE